MHILRNKKFAKKVWITLAILVIPPFVFWGAGSVMHGPKKPAYAGSIFGKNVPYQEYMDNLLAVRTSAMMRFGDEFEKIEKYINLPNQAWERILLLKEAQKRKVRVADSAVVEQIRAFPFFQEKGSFNLTRYKQALQYGLNIQARKFEEQMRGTLIIQKLYESLTQSIKLTEEEVKEEYIKTNEKIKVAYIAALPGNFLPKTGLTDEEIFNFYNKNIDKFKIEVAADIHYIGLDYPAGASEEDKEKINAKVRETAGQIKPNEDLAKLAQKNGLQVKDTGFFSIHEPIPGIGLSPIAWEAINKLEKDEISDAIATQGGCYILKIKDKRTDYTPAFKESREKANGMLLREKGLEAAKEKINECLKELTALKNANTPVSFENIAKQYGLTQAVTEAFSRSSYIPGVGNYPEFSKAAFELADNGQISKIIETPSGFYIARLLERIKINEDDFSKEKKDFSQSLLERKKNEAFSSFITELRKKADIRIAHR